MIEKYLYKYKKDKILLKAVILYPSSYKVGMSSLGYQWVYHLVLLRPDFHCERAFADSPGSRVKTTESGRTLSEFDCIFISISFETDIINIVNALAMEGLLDKKKRGPVIIAGGIASAIIPLYLKEIADVIISGDADDLIPEVLKALGDKSFIQYRDRNEAFLALKGKDGIYDPETLETPTLPYHCGNSLDPVHSVIISDKAEFSSSGLIEVSKSCMFKCSFCLVSNVYGDYRHITKERIIAAAGRFLNKTGKLGLVAATLTNHPDFRYIISELNRMDFKLSFSAFRIEGLDDELLEKIIINENRTLVIAPETASENLKKAIGKYIPDEKIIDTVRRAARVGIKRLKLYFMIGLPEESTDDLDKMAEFVKEIRLASMENAAEFGYIPEIIVDINPLVPKPLTKMEGLPMENIAGLKRKIIYLKKRLHGLGRVFVIGESPKSALLQYKLSNNLMKFDEIKALAGVS